MYVGYRGGNRLLLLYYHILLYMRPRFRSLGAYQYLAGSNGHHTWKTPHTQLMGNASFSAVASFVQGLDGQDERGVTLNKFTCCDMLYVASCCSCVCFSAKTRSLVLLFHRPNFW